MSDRQAVTEATDGMVDLVAGMGRATPAPLFYIDATGQSHALNALARQLPEDHGAAEAFLSPVASGARAGHVVAYVPAEDAQARGAVVAAMVALTAEVVARRLEEDAHAAASLARASLALDAALERLSSATEVQAVADVVADAAQRALGAGGVAVFAQSDDGALEPCATRGLDGMRLRPVRNGKGLLGWAAARATPTCVGSLFRMPPHAPREEGRHAPTSTWLEPPFVLVPLMSGSHRVGLLCATGLPSAGAASDAPARLAALADKAGSAIAGALVVRQARREERVRREIEIARQIQRRLLHAGGVSFSGLDVAGECRAAAQVGGDFFGFRAVGDSLVATVFDVAGHGIGAAFCMTLVRAALAGEVAHGHAPSEALARANELACEDLKESGLFATAFLARLDRATGRIESASAGHARPIHWHAQQRRFVTHGEGGLPLGLFADSRYGQGEHAFGESDVLVIYTDGIVEAENALGEPFGRSRLMGAVKRLRRRRARTMLRALWAELERFTGVGDLRDDATLVVIRGTRGFGSRDTTTGDAIARSHAQAEPRARRSKVRRPAPAAPRRRST